MNDRKYDRYMKRGRGSAFSSRTPEITRRAGDRPFRRRVLASPPRSAFEDREVQKGPPFMAATKVSNPGEFRLFRIALWQNRSIELRERFPYA